MMPSGMATSTATPTAPRGGALRRDLDHRLLGGVCSGLGRHLGVDPLVVRLAFVAAATAAGAGLALYALAWVVVPAEAGGSRPQPRARAGRGGVEVALGVALLVLSVLLAFREMGLWLSDALVWPLVLVVTGAAVIWRQSLRPAGPPLAPSSPSGSASDTTGDAQPAAQRGPGAPDSGVLSRTAIGSVAPGAGVVSRTGIGVGLVVAAGLVFLQATDALSAARDVVLAALVMVVVLGVIFAPWIIRLLRSLAAERAERIRSQERSEMAAHLHDSVLQTLALVQKRAADQREVSALARRQERELRAWLSGRQASPGAGRRLAAELEAAADEVEAEHGVPVEVVAVGDRDLDEPGRALVAATREAMVNAAKFGGGSPVAVYAEASDEGAQVFVRDRGPGFDPHSVPSDRRGVRESIVGRMERHGGRASIHSSPGAGTEVELTLEGARS